MRPVETTFEEMRTVTLNKGWVDDNRIMDDWAVFSYKWLHNSEPQSLLLRTKPISRDEFYTGNWNLQLCPILPSTKAVSIIGWTADALKRALEGGTNQRYMFFYEP
jgi:hypothetical protein